MLPKASANSIENSGKLSMSAAFGAVHVATNSLSDLYMTAIATFGKIDRIRKGFYREDCLNLAGTILKTCEINS
jgi:hypothetical protein